MEITNGALGNIYSHCATVKLIDEIVPWSHVTISPHLWIQCYTKPWKLRERYITGGIIQLTVLCHCSEKLKVRYENKSGSCWNHMKEQSENRCSRWSAMIRNSGKSCLSGKIIAGMNHHVLLDDRELIPAAIISGSLFLIPYSKA